MIDVFAWIYLFTLVMGVVLVVIDCIRIDLDIKALSAKPKPIKQLQGYCGNERCQRCPHPELLKPKLPKARVIERKP